MIRRTLIITVAVLAATTLALESVVWFAIPLLFGSEFRDAVPIAQVLLVAGCLFSIKRVAVDLLRGIGNTGSGFRAECVAIAVFAASAVPLSDGLGGLGVAIAITIGAIVSGSYLVTAVLRVSGGLTLG